MYVIKIDKKYLANIKQKRDGNLIIHLKQLRENGLNKFWVVDGSFGMVEENGYVLVKPAKPLEVKHEKN